jgi:uncharacterized protein (TIGR02611 family)
MDSLKRTWRRTPKPVRQSLVLIAGSVIVITGLVGLALPVLPGWALIFVGFALLATEFAAAERVRDWLLGILKQLAAAGKRLWRKIVRR